MKSRIRQRLSRKKGRKSQSKKSRNTVCQRKKTLKVMREWKSGRLRTSYGAKVKDYRQAIAIALSMAHKSCAKRKKNKFVQVFNSSVKSKK